MKHIKDDGVKMQDPNGEFQFRIYGKLYHVTLDEIMFRFSPRSVRPAYLVTIFNEGNFAMTWKVVSHTTLWFSHNGEWEIDMKRLKIIVGQMIAKEWPDSLVIDMIEQEGMEENNE